MSLMPVIFVMVALGCVVTATAIARKSICGGRDRRGGIIDHSGETPYPDTGGGRSHGGGSGHHGSDPHGHGHHGSSGHDGGSGGHGFGGFFGGHGGFGGDGGGGGGHGGHG